VLVCVCAVQFVCMCMCVNMYACVRARVCVFSKSVCDSVREPRCVSKFVCLCLHNKLCQPECACVPENMRTVWHVFLECTCVFDTVSVSVTHCFCVFVYSRM